jgi:hypothetical protein
MGPSLRLLVRVNAAAGDDGEEERVVGVEGGQEEERGEVEALGDVLLADTGCVDEERKGLDESAPRFVRGEADKLRVAVEAGRGAGGGGALPWVASSAATITSERPKNWFCPPHDARPYLPLSVRDLVFHMHVDNGTRRPHAPVAIGGGRHGETDTLAEELEAIITTTLIPIAAGTSVRP